MKKHFPLIIASFLLLAFTSNAFAENTPCGLEGTIEERIQDCAQNEVYLDTQTHLIWGDLIRKKIGERIAHFACELNLRENGNLPGKFRLPTLAEYQAADADGIRSALPRMSGNWFWTSTLYFFNNVYDYAWAFDGTEGDTSFVFVRRDPESARCVQSLN